MKGGLKFNNSRIPQLSDLDDLMVILHALLLKLDENKLKSSNYDILLNCIHAGWTDTSTKLRFYYQLNGPWATNMHKQNYPNAAKILSDNLRVSGNKMAEEAERLELPDIVNNIHSFCIHFKIPIDSKWSQVSKASQSSQLKLMEGDMLSTIREMRVLLHEF